ncbi:MAG: hypothetical protein FWE88_04525 [Phycisphaerae bacterium]|nr:hypothetical protein [Phycisphaerae bacterium]
MRMVWIILAVLCLAGCEAGLGTSLSRKAPVRRDAIDLPQSNEQPEMPRSKKTPRPVGSER